MSVNKTRGLLYKAARLLGDYKAISSGSPKKMTRRVGHRVTGRGLRKLLKKQARDFASFQARIIYMAVKLFAL